MPKEMTRQQANYAILLKLQAMVAQYPDWRFNQILHNVNVTDPNEDRFYQESVDTLKGMETSKYGID